MYISFLKNNEFLYFSEVLVNQIYLFLIFDIKLQQKQNRTQKIIYYHIKTLPDPLLKFG